MSQVVEDALIEAYRAGTGPFSVFTGEVLGFNISRRHDAAFVRLAIERAQRQTETLPLWFHSDQGSEYASEEVSQWLTSRRNTSDHPPLLRHLSQVLDCTALLRCRLI